VADGSSEGPSAYLHEAAFGEIRGGRKERREHLRIGSGKTGFFFGGERDFVLVSKKKKGGQKVGPGCCRGKKKRLSWGSREETYLSMTWKRGGESAIAGRSRGGGRKRNRGHHTLEHGKALLHIFESGGCS